MKSIRLSIPDRHAVSFVLRTVCAETSERGGVSPLTLGRKPSSEEPGGLRGPAQKHLTWPTRFNETGFVRGFIATFVTLCFAVNAVAQTPPSFERAVAPILIKRCLECHGETDPSGKLNLTSHDSLMRGGESGPAVVKFDIAKSLLVARITSGEMPPPKRGHSQKLPENELTTLQMWIIFGAQWPDGRRECRDWYHNPRRRIGSHEWQCGYRHLEPGLRAAGCGQCYGYR